MDITGIRPGRMPCVEQAEEPAAYRTVATAPLLGLDGGEALFGVDRLLREPDTGSRALHRTLIPFTTTDDEQLAQASDTEPEQICAVLTAAGHKLTWH